jgi:hypothetical protein
MKWRVAPTPRLSGTRNLLIDIEIYLPAHSGVHSQTRKIGKASCVRIVLVGTSEEADSLAEELAGPDLVVDRHPDDALPGDGADEVEQIARDLRELERILGDRRPEAVLVASASSAALAAVLVATKLEIPAFRLEIEVGDPPGSNADLIRQLADAALAPEPAAILRRVRGTYTPRA